MERVGMSRFKKDVPNVPAPSQCRRVTSTRPFAESRTNDNSIMAPTPPHARPDDDDVEEHERVAREVASRMVVVKNGEFINVPGFVRVLLKVGPNKPTVFVNLLKFRERARYLDGWHKDWSGARAYMRYVREVEPLIRAVGARLVYSGKIKGSVVGSESDPWDAIVCVRYKSLRSVVELLTSPLYLQASRHRLAGLDGELLLATTETENLADRTMEEEEEEEAAVRSRL